MSGSAEGDANDRQALSDLESAVGRLLDELERLRARTARAEGRVKDVETLLRRFTKGEDDPARLHTRVSALESENRALKGKVREGREGVDRILARIQFLEEQR